MGDRKKLIYKNGIFTDALKGDTLFSLTLKRELIIQSEYAVTLKRKKRVTICENEKGIFQRKEKATGFSSK